MSVYHAFYLLKSYSSHVDYSPLSIHQIEISMKGLQATSVHAFRTENATFVNRALLEHLHCLAMGRTLSTKRLNHLSCAFESYFTVEVCGAD